MAENTLKDYFAQFTETTQAKEDLEEARAAVDTALARLDLRRRRGFSQRDLAARLGMHQQAISRIEGAPLESLRVEALDRYCGGMGYRLNLMVTDIETGEEISLPMRRGRSNPAWGATAFEDASVSTHTRMPQPRWEEADVLADEGLPAAEEYRVNYGGFGVGYPGSPFPAWRDEGYQPARIPTGARAFGGGPVFGADAGGQIPPERDYLAEMARIVEIEATLAERLAKIEEALGMTTHGNVKRDVENRQGEGEGAIKAKEPRST